MKTSWFFGTTSFWTSSMLVIPTTHANRIVHGRYFLLLVMKVYGLNFWYTGWHVNGEKMPVDAPRQPIVLRKSCWCNVIMHPNQPFLSQCVSIYNCWILLPFPFEPNGTATVTIRNLNPRLEFRTRVRRGFDGDSLLRGQWRLWFSNQTPNQD